MKRFLRVSIPFAAMFLASCGADPAETPPPTPETSGQSASTSLDIIRVLSTDDMGGRLTGTTGNAKARTYLLAELAIRGLDVTQEAFTFTNRSGEEQTGINLLTRIEGKNEGPVMVVTAHYDHVGTRDGEVFNGADDNASGVAGAIAVADHFLAEPPEHDVLIDRVARCRGDGASGRPRSGAGWFARRWRYRAQRQFRHAEQE